MIKSSEEKWVKTTCAYCGVGCGIEARPNANGTLDIRGDVEHPANRGKLCSKGMALGETVGYQGRLLEPVVNGKTCDWPSALDHVGGLLSKTIEQYGPDSVAFYVSGQLLTEDYYIANKLMKGFIGSANIDTNSRLCMSSSVAGHKRAFGEDCVPGCYDDLELADLVILTGSNLAWCHPVLFQRLRDARENRGTKIVVIDPRRTATCDIADLHLAINPGSDVALFNGLLTWLADNSAIDNHYVAEHTKGIDTALAEAASFRDLALVEEISGIPQRELETFYSMFLDTRRTVTVYSQGVNQSTSGTDKVNSILNCHLVTGRVGKPGSTPFSVTGQPNAMGGREVGGLANMLACHRDFGDPAQDALISEFWQTETLASHPGLKAIDMFDAIEAGQIKVLWVMATNPAVSLPDSDRINKILSNCEHVIVSDCIADSDTLRHADIALPAQGWGEKSGTVTNSERRISRQRKLLPSPGQAKPDWWILCEVAKRMGFADTFSFRHEGEIFDEYARMTALTPNAPSSKKPLLTLSGLAGLSPEAYRDLSPQQWPVLDKNVPVERLYSNGRFSTPDGKANIVPTPYLPPASKTCEDFPLLLNTGRLRDQWHTMTRSGLSPRLSEHSPEPTVAVNPSDASTFNLKEGQLAKVASVQGSVVARLQLNNNVQSGTVFMPIHWSETFSSMGKTCKLIAPAIDPISGQPEFKITPVNIHPMNVASEAMLAVNTAYEDSAIRSDILARLLLCGWTKRHIEGGKLFHLQSPVPKADFVSALTTSLSAKYQQSLQSSINGCTRVVFFSQGELAAAIAVSEGVGQVEGADISSLFSKDDLDVAAFSSGNGSEAGRIVCACKQVGVRTLTKFMEKNPGATLSAMSSETQAGTGCGSCLPELRMLNANA